MYDWTKLNKSKKNIVAKLLDDWQQLIEQKKSENDYHSFLVNHSGFFLSDFNSLIAISKLKLGSEFETDFVIIKDGFSKGTIYEFIEIEKPWSKLFTGKGIPSIDLNTSLQQIRDWRRWLTENKDYFKKYLPTSNTRVIQNSNLKFKIITGRRNLTELEINKREQISSENNVEIRSFDSLTDYLKNRIFLPYSLLDDKEKLNDDVLVQIVNPFSMAISDSDWREICDNTRIPRTHIYSNISDLLIKKMKSNNLINLL